jgi:hypothetical protein
MSVLICLSTKYVAHDLSAAAPMKSSLHARC